LNIAIAGSLAKWLKYIQKEEEDSKEDWANIIRNRRVLDTQNRPPNYSDPVFLNTTENRSKNWDGIIKNNPNWDGLPAQEE